MEENEKYLTEQIITYLGNKRSLLSFIGKAVNIVKERLNKDKLDILDAFSGSGIVSRMLKQHSNVLYSNDLENYCYTINKCYLTNKQDIDFAKLTELYRKLQQETSNSLRPGFISEMYAPLDDKNIQKGERVFYTTRNAHYIDTIRQLLELTSEPYKTMLLAPLLYEASVHTNTSGIFKAFYKNSKTGIGQYGGNGKNALFRILSDIHLKLPILSNFDCKSIILQKDANLLCNELPAIDLAYLDPPYNQHPYSSNYFMLNLINDYKKPEKVSKVSGIPDNWNRSNYNFGRTAKSSLYELCKSLNAKYLLISFNSEGYISYKEMTDMLSSIGDLEIFDAQHNVFRGCRNLASRNIYVTEYLYLVKKS